MPAWKGTDVSPIVTLTTAPLFVERTDLEPIMTSGAWSSSNLAVYIPIYLPRPLKTGRIQSFSGSAVGNSLDHAIYSPDADGKPATRLTTTTPFAQSGTNAIQIMSFTPIFLPAGLLYLACAMNGTTSTVLRMVALAADGLNKAAGIFTEAAAYPLPATATPVLTPVTANVPIMGIELNTF